LGYIGRSVSGQRTHDGILRSVVKSFIPVTSVSIKISGQHKLHCWKEAMKIGGDVRALPKAHRNPPAW